MSLLPFSQRFLALAKERSPFCLGVDPTTQLLQQWGLPDNADGLASMCRIIVQAAGNRLALVKPQAAYFERFGPEGMVVLKQLVDDFHAAGSLVLLDVKRCDIGSTSQAYAESYIGKDSAYGGDAMTVVAYMGFGALAPVVKHAAAVGAGLFVIVRSSNPEGALLQSARLENGLTVADHLAEEITACNHAYSGDAVGLIGAVMGATLTNAGETAARLNQSLFLCPGIGFQGATMADMAATYHGAAGRLIPTSSRGVLAAGPDSGALREAIEMHCREADEL